jgi:hypothetical protein
MEGVSAEQRKQLSLEVRSLLGDITQGQGAAVETMSDKMVFDHIQTAFGTRESMARRKDIDDILGWVKSDPGQAKKRALFVEEKFTDLFNDGVPLTVASMILFVELESIPNAFF